MATPLVDALGSTLELTDASGTPQTHYTFEPFRAATVSGAATSNSAQFTGRENDGTSTYYYRGTYYSPGVGRFISEDLLLFQGNGWNLYPYAENNPINLEWQRRYSGTDIAAQRITGVNTPALLINGQDDKLTNRSSNERRRPYL